MNFKICLGTYHLKSVHGLDCFDGELCVLFWGSVVEWELCDIHAGFVMMMRKENPGADKVH